MRHLSAAMALSFMASSTFAAIIVDFNENNNYKTESAKLEDDQDSWSSWTKENGVLKTTIKGDKFSSAIVVPPPECDAGYQKLVVSYTSNCGDGNNIAAYGYDSYFPTDPWYEIGSFKSGQEVDVQCDAFTKIALQAQTSSTKECNVSVSSIFIGMQSEILVAGASVPNMSDYKKSGDSISLSIPFKSRLDSIKPTFSGYFGSVSPSTAQDFTDGPVTYTFSAKSGTETQTIVLSIAKLPGDTNAYASSFIGFCSKPNIVTAKKTYSDSPAEQLTPSVLAKQGVLCSEGTKVTHPKGDGDTGTVLIDLYKWTPDSIKTKMYGRWNMDETIVGFLPSPRATLKWYYKGEEMDSVNLSKTALDLENTVLQLTAENKKPVHYYKFKFNGVEPENILYDMVMIDTLKSDYFYPRTIYDPTSPNDTGSIIYDLPYNSTVAPKLFVCGTGDSYYMNSFKKCDNTFQVSDSSVVSVHGTLKGSSGMYVTLTNGYDKRLYAITLNKQTKAWPMFEVAGVYVNDHSQGRHYSYIMAEPGDTKLKFTVRTMAKVVNSYDDDFGIVPVSTNPFMQYGSVFESDNLWDTGSKIKITAFNEDNQKRILSATMQTNSEKSVAELRGLFIQFGPTKLPGTIDQEKKFVQVDLPFEMNLKRASFTWAGPHGSYCEEYEQNEFYDLSDTINFVIHSADSTKSATYKVVFVYNPDAFKPEVDTTKKDTTVKDSTGKKEAIPLVFKKPDASVRLVGNTLLYEGDIADVRSLSIFDAQGHRVYAQAGLKSASLDVRFMNRGVYIVRAETKRGLVTARIAKRK